MDIDIFQVVSKVDIRIIKLEFLRRLFTISDDLDILIAFDQENN